MALKTILLDAGGVLLDETDIESAYASLISDILSRIIPSYSQENYRKDIEEAVISFCPNVYQYTIWKNCANDRDLFEKLFLEFSENCLGKQSLLRIYPGVADEVRNLSNDFKLLIAGQYGPEIIGILEKASIMDCFANRLTQDDFKITKPDPRYFVQIAEAIGSRPEECIMVGDRIDKDIIPAKMIGMRTIRIRGGLHQYQRPRIPGEIPDIELDGVNGLAAAIRRII